MKYLTVDEWEEKNIDLGAEIFEPVFEVWFDTLYGYYDRLVGFRGVESGRLLHPDFDGILESAGLVN